MIQILTSREGVGDDNGEDGEGGENKGSEGRSIEQ